MQPERDYRAEAKALQEAGLADLRALLLAWDAVQNSVHVATASLRTLERAPAPPTFGELLSKFLCKWSPNLDNPGFDCFQDELHDLLRAAALSGKGLAS
jgi:hypothetical protein